MFEKTEYEYWTKDEKGHGFCSTTSLTNAIAGHFNDMTKKDPLGPIVDVYVIKRVVKETVTKASLTGRDWFFEPHNLEKELRGED